MPVNVYNPSEDTFIWAGLPTINFDSSAYLSLGKSVANSLRILLLFDLTNILQADIITAELNLYQYNVPASAQPFEIWRMTQDWISDECTWNVYKTGSNWPGGAGAAGDADDTLEVEGNTLDDIGWCSLGDIRALTQDAVDNRNGYLKLLIKEKLAANDDVNFRSMEYSEYSVWPFLSVRYNEYMEHPTVKVLHRPLLRHVKHRDLKSGI
jgi:hypothetical protein